MAVTHDVDLLLVGAGPVGLFGAFCGGARGLQVALVDSLTEPGGQITALYPEKRIYDVGGIPQIVGHVLVDQLVEQAGRFNPLCLYGEEAQHLRMVDDGFVMTTSTGTEIQARAVIVTGGVGTFTPRALPAGEEYLGRGLAYFVHSVADYADQDVVIVGGGDSACDWVLALHEVARSVTLVHRRKGFRAHAGTLDAVHASGATIILDAQVTALRETPDSAGWVGEVEVTVKGEGTRTLKAQRVVAALGFMANLGPVREWAMELHEDRFIVVDTHMASSIPGVFAAGDIVDYPGKVRLIATGFGEVATAVNNAAVYIDPEAEVFPGHSSESASASSAT